MKNIIRNFYENSFFEFEQDFDIVPFGGFNENCLEESDSGCSSNQDCDNPQKPSNEENGNGKSNEGSNTEGSNTEGSNTEGSNTEGSTESKINEIDELSETNEEISESNNDEPISIKIGDLDLSFDENEVKDSKKEKLNKVGGKQLDSKSKIVKVSHQVRASLERLANGMTFQKMKGQKVYDGKLLLTNLISYKYGEIITSKNDFKPKEIYFFVDTSGSVWYLADMILTLINSTIKSKQIKVFSGSESHPNKDEKTGEVFSHKRHRYLDQELQICFEREKPSDETVMVFWGDCQGSGIREKELSKILSKYNPIWLNPSLPNEIEQNSSWEETPKAAKIMPMKLSVNSISAFIKQLKKI